MFPIAEQRRALEQLCGVGDIFTYYRLVDPISHQTYRLENGHAVADGTLCFAAWERGKACRNCISLRACTQNCPQTKLEHSRSKVFLVVARPCQIDGANYALELSCDMTRSLVLSDESTLADTDVGTLVYSLNELALHDSYTGLYNKSFMQEKAILLAHTAKQLHLLILDIDHFKQINDQHGHLIGDNVIVVLAQVLKALNKMQGCFASRMGGDEFSVFFADMPLAQAEALVQRVLDEIEAHTFTAENASFHIRVSYGFGTREQDEALNTFFHRVDKLMYANKALRHPPK